MFKLHRRADDSPVATTDDGPVDAIVRLLRERPTRHAAVRAPITASLRADGQDEL